MFKYQKDKMFSDRYGHFCFTCQAKPEIVIFFLKIQKIGGMNEHAANHAINARLAKANNEIKFLFYIIDTDFAPARFKTVSVGITDQNAA